MKKISGFLIIVLFYFNSFSEHMDLNQIYSGINQPSLKILAIDLTVLGRKSLEFDLYVQNKFKFKEDVYMEKLNDLDLLYDKIYLTTSKDEKLKLFAIEFISIFYRLTNYNYSIYLYEKLVDEYNVNVRLSFSEHADNFLDAVSDAAQESHEESGAPWPLDWSETGIGAIAGGIGYIVGAIEAESSEDDSGAGGGW
ncbi:MAG: hypothetical protein M0Q02_03205 [Candidatus Muirbacterium halophilum]|nr:hypothetical protein [Candidatus Muirbacterium halophilum]